MSLRWPFAQWGINLIKRLPKGRGAAAQAIVAIDYFTKWVEVETLDKIRERGQLILFRSTSCVNMKFSMPRYQ